MQQAVQGGGSGSICSTVTSRGVGTRRKRGEVPQIRAATKLLALPIACLGLSSALLYPNGATAFVIPSKFRLPPERERTTGAPSSRHALGTTNRAPRSASGPALTQESRRVPTGQQLRMILSESPAAAICRRALQRAWQAPSPPRDEHARPERSDEMADDRGLDFRLTTFNLLAPCYKRMHAGALPPALSESARSGLLAGQATVSHRTARESEFADVWRQRAVETADFIRREMSSSDIICLQEFWFDQAYEAIFRAALGDDYNFHTLQRTGSKDDGVAVLLRRGKWEVRSSSGLSLSPVGDRVALVMHLRTVQSKSENSLGGVSKHAGTPAGAGGDGTRGGAAQHGGEDVILVNTHLAFPHHAHDRVNQVWQIRTVTEAVECLVRDAGLPTMTPRVVVGDLNVEDSDPVCRHLSTNGFRSAFASLHREQRVVTHLNHRGEEVMVDHVFVKAPGSAGTRRGPSEPAASEGPGTIARMHDDLTVEEAVLLPGDVGTDVWSPTFALSDHRPLTVSLKFPAH